MKWVCRALLIAFLGLSGSTQELAERRVAVPLIVTDSHYTPVSVTVESLVITDENMPVTGARLLRGSDLPVELGVLIDTSASERDRQADEIVKAVRQFVDAIIRGPEDRVFFVQFWAVSQLGEWLTKNQLQSYTMDKAHLGGGTALYDALFVACQKRMGQRDWRKPTRRVLLLISDGEDNLSHVKPEEAVSEALKAGVVIFTINNGGWNSQMKGKKTMDHWAQLTGGEAFSQIHGKEMPKTLSSVQAMIDTMYYLNYAPPDAAKSAVHKIEVKSAAKEKLKLSYPTKYLWNP